MKKIYILSLVISMTQIVFAQDSTQWEMSLGVEASGIHLNPFNKSKKINVEKDLRIKRFLNNPLRPSGYVVTDNTNFHFGTYAALKAKVAFRKKYEFQAHLFFEDRGASYGANDLNNIVWFPIFSFTFQDTFHILKQRFEIDFNAGNKTKHQIGNGLKIYNIDDQSLNYKISHKNFFYEYDQIADLSFGIGVNIEEYFQFTLGYENSIFKASIYHAINKTNPINNIDIYPEWGISANYFFNKNFELFFQGGTRYLQEYNLRKNSAFVLGANCTLIDNNKFTWKFIPKIRYYTSNYNLGHADTRVKYRNLGKLYSNTVGRYLYPLRNYYNDFDQWAVFTEYQNENILGLILKTEFKYQIIPKLFIHPNLEILTIHRSEEFYTNFYYSLDIYFQPAKGLNLGILLTNKTYNLDVHYPTFYMMKNPMIGVNLRLDLDNLKIL